MHFDPPLSDQDLGQEIHLKLRLKTTFEIKNIDKIAYVAAGPLKDLFFYHHEEIKESLTILVRKHQCMSKAIQGFILSSGSHERKALNEILSKFGLRHASL